MSLQQILQRCTENRHRCLIIIKGNGVRSLAVAERLCVQLNNVQRIGLAGSRRKKSSVTSFLGQECDSVIFDVRSGFDLDQFAALAGSIRAGGQMILLTPEFSKWQSFEDPDTRRWIPHAENPLSFGHRFITRWTKLAGADPDVFILNPQKCTEDERLTIIPSKTPVYRITVEQSAVIRAVGRVLNGHRRRPLLLTADRGRGKTAALGMAAAELLKNSAICIGVVAVKKSALEALFRHANYELGNDPDDEFSIQHKQSSVRYLSLQQLLNGDESLDLVMVDEAAAFPLSVLTRILSKFSRLVFSTTIHGYEGSGRGFALKFDQLVQQQSRGVARLEIKTPIRYNNDDPLENFIFQSLLLNAEPGSGLGRLQPEKLSIRYLSQDELRDNEGLMRQVFGLLVQSHYRTRPSDVRQFMDSPQMRIVIAEQGHRVVGVLVLASEGGLNETTSEQIWLGNTRPRGHLFAESLAFQLGLREGAALCGARIVRVVVHADLRRSGIGKKLLKFVVNQSQQQGLDYVGSSFSLGEGMIPFWEGCEFKTIRVGYKQQTASGAPAVLVIKVLWAELEAMQMKLATDFRSRLLLELPARQCAIESTYVLELLQSERFIDAYTKDTEILRFINGSCSLDSVWLSAHRAACHLVSDSALQDGFRILLVDTILKQGRAGEDLKGSDGRSQITERVRQGFRDYFATEL
ncbi:MAG: tRNA(Met) cytidine acetyltransferase [Parasphingorhabdus sp.]|jgi:tRNA(Met) cytidine acetyltransferase